MKEAVAYIQNGHGLREAARLYNVPVETLRRRTSGKVSMECKPGPLNILTKDEEKCLVGYVTDLADRGFGLTNEDLMRTAFAIVERSGHPQPFHDGKAGCGWLVSGLGPPSAPFQVNGVRSPSAPIQVSGLGSCFAPLQVVRGHPLLSSRYVVWDHSLLPF